MRSLKVNKSHPNYFAILAFIFKKNYQKIRLLSIFVVMQTIILLWYVVKWDIFHPGVERGFVDSKIQAISSTLRWCKFSFLIIVGSNYVFHSDNYNDVSSLKINQHTCLFSPPQSIFVHNFYSQNTQIYKEVPAEYRRFLGC